MSALPPMQQVPRSLGEIAAEIVADVRFQRQCRKLHQLGPRAVAEFLAELAAEHIIGISIDAKLERYGVLTPEQVGAARADRMPPLPVHVVGGCNGTR